MAPVPQSDCDRRALPAIWPLEQPHFLIFVELMFNSSGGKAWGPESSSPSNRPRCLQVMHLHKKAGREQAEGRGPPPGSRWLTMGGSTLPWPRPSSPVEGQRCLSGADHRAPVPYQEPSSLLRGPCG